MEYPVEKPEDLEKLRSVPWSVPEGLDAPTVGHADRSIVRLAVSSPFVCVAGSMTFQSFLELCATDLPLVRELTEVCAGRIMATLDHMLGGRQVDYLWIGGCEWLTPPMGSPKLYAELVQPYEAAIIERAHAAGAAVHVHCHGNVRTTIESVIDRGGNFLEPVEPPPDGDITMAEAKVLAGGRITLGGNIEARVIELEGADAVEQAVREAFRGGKERMVLKCTEGLIRRMTPRMVANYHRLIDVWEELSPM